MTHTKIARVAAAWWWTIAACSTSAAPSPVDVPVARDVEVVDAADAVEAGPACNGNGPQPAGGACQCGAPDDCEPGSVCGTEGETGFPGGACVTPCDPAAPARAGYRCMTFQAQSSYVRLCGPDAGVCRDGWFCRVRLTSSGAVDRYVCEPSCAGDEQCHDGRTCNRYTGFCEAVGEGRPNFAPCTVGDQCRGGVCLPSGVGSCTSLCDTRAGACPEGGFCLPPLQADAGAQNGTCLQECTATTDCPMGFACQRAAGHRVCAPTQL